MGRPVTIQVLAADVATRELAEFRDFAIDAGCDLYLGGRNMECRQWRVAIRHPQRPGEVIARAALYRVCTSGGYERPMAGAAGEHHILDPPGRSPRGVASATVIAPNAILADALATAALVLRPDKGLDLLDRSGVEGLIVTEELAEFRTRSREDAA